MKIVQQEKEWVLLGQAGYPAPAIWAQVHRINNSKAFDGMERLREILAYLVEESLLGHVPQPDAIAMKFGSTGKTYAQTQTGRIRELLDAHYADLAKRREIRLAILPKSYILVAPRHIATASGIEIPAKARIFEPTENAYVGAHVRVRGMVDSLDPDLRLWLIVLAGDDHYYLQTRISRRSQYFDVSNRAGRTELGKYEGERYSFLLVAADMDADYAFQTSKNECREVFGDRLPADTKVLASVEVERRDFPPPNQPPKRTSPSMLKS